MNRAFSKRLTTSNPAPISTPLTALILIISMSYFSIKTVKDRLSKSCNHITSDNIDSEAPIESLSLSTYELLLRQDKRMDYCTSFQSKFLNTIGPSSHIYLDFLMHLGFVRKFFKINIIQLGLPNK